MNATVSLEIDRSVDVGVANKFQRASYQTVEASVHLPRTRFRTPGAAMVSSILSIPHK